MVGPGQVPSLPMLKDGTGLEGIIVSLRDKKATVLNIRHIKLHCKSMGNEL